MKKFYFLVLTVMFALTSFLAKAQYNSITDGNPNGYTLDDPRFWQGDTPPPSPCTGCTIKINSSVTMVHGPGFTTSDWGVLLRTSAPATGPNHDPDLFAITVGLKFFTQIPTVVTGAKFYKTVGMTGTHVGLLYDNTGTLVATANFASETASGWQEQAFTPQVALPANTTYMIAVFMPDGEYNSTVHDLDANIQHGALIAPAGTGPLPNGLFAKALFAAGPQMPNAGFNNTNYWVDAAVKVDGNFLDNATLTGSTINLYGSTTFTLNTYLQLFNSSITLGNDPVSTEAIKLNDQLDLNGTSFVQLANNLTSIDANDNGTNVIQGPHQQVGNAPTIEPGIYAINGGDPLGYTATLQADGLGSATHQYLPPPSGLDYYSLNCDPGVAGSPNTCTDGIVYGPALTQLASDPTFGVVFIGSTTLPVQLVQFIASKGNDGSTNLTWSTSQEVNAGYYDIERSGDQTGWAKIGSVKAKGNSSITTNYSYSDKLPLNGVGYYRLKMIDLDGKYVYSKTVTVTGDKNASPLVVYNNPFSDLIRLKVNVSRAQTLTMTVSDMMGKTYIQQSYKAQAGDNLVNLQPAVIGGSGMYILRINGDSYNQTVKLEKQ
jgi:Domain of unknown function (DUF4082)